MPTTARVVYLRRNDQWLVAKWSQPNSVQGRACCLRVLRKRRATHSTINTMDSSRFPDSRMLAALYDQRSNRVNKPLIVMYLHIYRNSTVRVKCYCMLLYIKVTTQLIYTYTYYFQTFLCKRKVAHKITSLENQ